MRALYIALIRSIKRFFGFVFPLSGAQCMGGRVRKNRFSFGRGGAMHISRHAGIVTMVGQLFLKLKVPICVS